MPQDRDAAFFLDEAALIFETRNAAYGNTYRTTGSALLGLFGGCIPEISSPDEAQRLYLLTLCLIKMKRYAQNLKTGHKDSADDLMVYAAMLREATDEPKS